MRKLQEFGMVHTPSNASEMETFIKNVSVRPSPSDVVLVHMVTWNYAAGIMNAELEKAREKARQVSYQGHLLALCNRVEDLWKDPAMIAKEDVDILVGHVLSVHKDVPFTDPKVRQMVLEYGGKRYEMDEDYDPSLVQVWPALIINAITMDWEQL